MPNNPINNQTNPNLSAALGFGGSPTPAVSPQPTPEVPPSGGSPSGSILDMFKSLIGPVGTQNYNNAANVLSHKKSK